MTWSLEVEIQRSSEFLRFSSCGAKTHNCLLAIRELSAGARKHDGNLKRDPSRD